MIHHYPFGLVQQGISSKALSFGNPQNKYMFNGIEQNNDFDLNMYDAYYRNLDPQIGRFWQIDPKPNFGESLYSAMSNNPILYSDFLGDTVKYANGAGGEQARQMVAKFTNRTVINKKGKEVANKNYNAAFANVISKLDGAVDNFVFNFDAKATEGAVTYDGKDVNVTIGEPGDAYGTNVGAGGILFEETKHAEQILDGKVHFEKNSSGDWKTNARLENEVEAKLFVSKELGFNRYYTDKTSGFDVPTQLGYLNSLKKADDRMLFLRNGAQNINVVNNSNGARRTANITGAYPTLTNIPSGVNLTQRTKNDKIFGYPSQ